MAVPSLNFRIRAMLPSHLNRTPEELRADWQAAEAERARKAAQYHRAKRRLVQRMSLVLGVYGFVAYFAFAMGMPGPSTLAVGICGALVGAGVGFVVANALWHRLAALAISGLAFPLALFLLTRIGLMDFVPSFGGFYQMCIIAGFPIAGFALGYVVEVWDHDHLQV